MTGPGPRPPRGRHAAPDDDARPEEAGPGGRHAAGDSSGRRDPELPGLTEPPRRRRHAAPDDSPTGVTYHRPTLGNAVTYRRPEPGPNGHAPSAGYTPPASNGHRAPGTGDGYAAPSTGHRAQPAPDSYGGTGEDRVEPSTDGYARFGYHRPTPGGDGYPRPEPGPGEPGIGWRPGAGDPGVGYRGSEPGVGYGEPGFGYHRPEPGAHRYRGAEAAPRPWPETNGYHLETPAPPGVNGYRLDEPVAPVTGFPYTAPPATPIAYPVNGHGVDAAERDAASWPARGNAVWPVDARGPDLDQPPDPPMARVPLADEPTEILDRPKLQPAATPRKPPHPPRAVVRRRRARRRALEWPVLIVFAVLSAFLIRQYVVQTFYIPSASMHETLLEGDRVLVNKVGYHLHDIHRGDVVVFRKPPNLNVNEDDLIKRVIGLPGETVEGRDGKVYVNGAPLQEPYVEPLCHGTGEFPKVTVPAGKLWVMGDNRCNSSDSRVFGPIDQHLVVGRAFVLAWPLDRVAWL